MRFAGPAVLMAAVLTLSACDGTPILPQQTATPGTSAVTEVEAPAVFSVIDTALWDGRPSLGGIWVASPDATDPERVRITNTATGASIVGALFRREAFNPGPKLQLSSDAAEALGLLAGEPTKVTVVALRKMTPEVDTEVNPADIGADAVAAIAKPPAPNDGAGTKPQQETAAAPVSKPTAAPAPASKPTPATAPVSNGTGNKIQVAIFSVEENASKTLARLSAAGVSATVSAVKRGDKPLWVVTAVAPDDAAALLAKVKSLGFADAYVMQQ